MNIKKVLVTVFIGINIVTLWCQQPDTQVMASMHIPKSLVTKDSFDCVLASDWNRKTECARQGYVLLGSVQNPLYQHSGKKDMQLLKNQKYGFIYYKVPQQKSSAINQERKYDLIVDIPEQDLIQSIETERIQVYV